MEERKRAWRSARARRDYVLCRDVWIARRDHGRVIDAKPFVERITEGSCESP